MHHISAADPVERTYDRYGYIEEMRNAVLKWEQHVLSVIEKASQPELVGM
jgi:hypothetical protein